jgi:DNA mismatch repair ATPase MutS
MKAFLMFRDRDFDAEQLLARRDQAARSRSKNDHRLDLQQMLPWNEEALRKDLGLDIVLSAMAVGDGYLFDTAKVAVLSSSVDLDTILYRQHVLSDCLRNAEIVRDIYQLAIEAIEGERKGLWSFFQYPAGILRRAVEVMLMFVDALKRLRATADQHASKFESDGFSRLFVMLREELSDEYFSEIDMHLKRLKFRHGVLISAELSEGNNGRNYVLRKPHEDQRSWLTRVFSEKPPVYSFRLHPRDEAGARALSELNDRGLNLVANALAQSADHILSFFQMLRTELAFYIGCLNLHTRLNQMREATCFPIPTPMGERKLTFSGLYDIALALSIEQKVIGNDLNADGSNLLVITGANTGGKSTFLRSVGLAQLMLQAGMFVPAESFCSEVCRGIFTHYKREEDVTMESGKWDEELSRMSEIVDRLKPNSILMLNESFSSTNQREGSEIAGQIVRALLEDNVKVLFVTHLYHFARNVFVHRPHGVTFLRAERRSDGTRPFKLIEGEPLQTSYGEDLYRAIFIDDAEEVERSMAKSDKSAV